MTSGRLRTICPEDDELIELGKDLVRWATEETDEFRCRFCQWYSPRGILDKVWKLMVIKEVFCPYYEEARQALSRRFLDGTVNPSIAHRFMRIYCPEVKEEENEKTLFDARAAKEAAGDTVDAVIAEQQSALMNQISALQDSLKASRKINNNDK